MNISLRKAHALQLKILEVISGTAVPTSIRINEFQEVKSTLNEARDKVRGGLKKKIDLGSILTSIRQAVCKKNYECGISSKLTKIADLNRNISLLSTIIKGSFPQEAVEIIERKLEKLSKQTEFLHRDADVAAYVLTKEDLEQYKKMLSGLEGIRANEKDAVLELNIKTEISLSEEDVGVLKEENLL